MSNNLVVIGGAMGGGSSSGGSARTPVTAPDSLRSVSIVEFVDGICEGEIEGFATADPLESVFLNDTPIKTAGVLNFQGVSLDYRLGTQDQTYIQGSEMTVGEDASAAIEFNVGSDVTIATPVTRTISSIIADAVRVTIQLNALWKRNPTSGDVNGTSVKLRIEVKPSGGAFQTVTLGGRDTISGKASSPYERSYHIELSQFGAAPYDIKLTRLTGETVDGTVSDTITWKSYTELMYAKLRYPNTAHARLTFDARHFQQVPRRGYLLKLQKVRVPGPAFYDPVLRTYTGTDWDGTFVTAWTRCPVWCFYDIITDPRYGLGKEVPEAYMDKWNLWSIAQRCDALIPDGFGGTEPRYSLDLFLQQDNDAKKVVQDIASNFDAMGFWHGGGIFTAQDSPKSVSALYTPANVIAGRFNYAGSARQVRYTVALVQWNDPDDFYKVATEYVEDTDGIARYGYREKKIVAVGCTSRGQAHRAGKRILLTSRLETDTVGFAVGLSGLVNKPGDIIRLSDPLKHNDLRLGGRVSSGATTNTIPLDAPVMLDAGQSYTVCIVMPDGELITASITTAAGTVQTLDVFPPLVAVPDQAAVWSLYSGSIPSIEFRILWITENATDEDGGFYEISAVRYDPTKYTEAESNLQLEPIYQQPYANTNKVIPPTGLVTSDGVYLGIEGIVRYVDISWSASDDSLLASHIIKWSLDNGEETEVTITGNSYRIESAKQGTYTIEVYAVNLGGLVSTSVTVDHVLGVLYLISSVSITGLTIKGSGTNTFEGRNAEFDWDTDADEVLGLSNSFGVGVGGQSPWFRDFMVKVYEGANLLRTDFVTESAYVYTFDKNIEDGGPFRAISIEVVSRDFYGNLSQSSALVVANPPPSAPIGVNVYEGAKSILLNYTKPTDSDFVGVVVFVSVVSGFVPGLANRVYVGGDVTITIPNLLEDTPYFIRIGSYDAFGGEGSYVLSSTEYTKTLSSINLPTPEEIKTSLQTALDAPAASPLVFEADVFALKLSGLNATPFLIGQVDGAPAILMDSDVYITSSLSVDQLRSGAIAATEYIKVGEGEAVISGDGSISVYDGPDTVSNRDFALLTGGDITFQRYRGGQYRTYKTLRRLESGIANSGDTVVLPGYWDSQPVMSVTPSGLSAYSASHSSSDQSWLIRVESLMETFVGSGIYQFDAIAELVYSDSTGETTINSANPSPSTDSWLSSESSVPANTTSVTVSLSMSSIRGSGVSSAGFYYRTITCTVQAYDSVLVGWLGVGSQVTNIASNQHGLPLSVDIPATLTTDHTKVRVQFVASDTDGTEYSTGIDTYNYNQEFVSSNGASTFSRAWGGGNSGQVTLSGPSYTPPAGWDVYEVNYSVQLKTNSDGDGNDSYTCKAIGGGVARYNQSAAFKNAPNAVEYGEEYDFTGFYPNPEGTYAAISSGFVSASSHSSSFWQCLATISVAWEYAMITIRNASATVKIRQVQTNSTTPDNYFQFVGYSWNTVGSSAIAVGSLSWTATGD